MEKTRRKTANNFMMETMEIQKLKANRNKAHRLRTFKQWHKKDEQKCDQQTWCRMICILRKPGPFAETVESLNIYRASDFASFTRWGNEISQKWTVSPHLVQQELKELQLSPTSLHYRFLCLVVLFVFMCILTKFTHQIIYLFLLFYLEGKKQINSLD